jgi:anti-sigma regulatory factor (Ser/Thr protein kinase)
MQAGRALSVDGRLSERVELTVSPRADFRDVIHALETITFPPTGVSGESIRFAILELVNNSIRAHREKNEEREIRIVLSVSDGRLEISIRDFGGGFNPKALPYDLDADPRTLDLHSAPFDDYQHRHGYKRFGMGIYVAKKTFDRFQISFLDHQEKPLPWQEGKVAGTLITLSISAEVSS